MNIKKSIVLRVRIAFVVMIVFSVAIIYKMFVIQWIQGDHWKERANQISFQEREIEATRGNIYSDNGSLLATSLPFYKVAFDPTVPSDEIFQKGVDSLAIALNKFFGNKSIAAYKNLLKDARLNNRQYVPISQRMINYHDKKLIADWPIFREGRYKGGVIFEKIDKRFNPFDDLSRRTIGFVNENSRGAGLEYSFNSQLAGQDGKAMYRKISGGDWKMIFDGSQQKTVEGINITTTIDVNLQDVSETALRKSLISHEADYGLVLVMEVATGEIKAISNLTRSNGHYIETYNHAVGGLHEPGSTIKLATMISLLEETNLSLEDSIDTGDGVYKIYNNRVKDHHEGGWGKITVRESFEKSSNVAMVKLVDKYFGVDPNRFINYFDKLNLTQPLNFQIKGEGVPKVPRPGDKEWSGITLPWMAHGYGLEITPLHILTLYNAVANGGKMVSPLIVKSTSRADEVINEFKSKVLVNQICSKETLAELQLMLEGVVEKGTAVNIKGAHYGIAGKTGTAQILDNGKYTSKYITSFAGYFPSHKPKYSAFVLIKNPKGWRQYGSNVAAPVFKEIADNIYARDVEMHEVYGNDESRIVEMFPLIRAGKLDELNMICDLLGVSNHTQDSEEWVRTNVKGNAVNWVSAKITPGLVPNVVGMTLRDAMFILENAGLRTSFKGKGRVESQSIRPGLKIPSNGLIELDLG